ncbi:hypothetical protein [Actinomadura sp. 21ATH]|uniref:hypothetical protein n=1 Tax=Actinomadura sp. 21ATH TaxID=1735444 RepID=UPI0035C1B219
MSDQHNAEIIDLNARRLAAALQAPGAAADDTAEYLAWARHKPAPRVSPRRRERPFLRSFRADYRRPLEPQGAPQASPAYAAAVRELTTLPDLGIAALDAAALAPGMADADYEALVIYAAAHPVQPTADLLEPDEPQDQPAPPWANATPCPGCGTALDPDGTCLTCDAPSALTRSQQ